MAELKVISGPMKGKLFKIGNGIATIGREQTNSVQINDYEISRRHAELHIRENERLLVDLGSANGTLVNGESVSKQQLNTRDQILLGRTVLEFHTDEFDREPRGSHDDTVQSLDDESNAFEETANSKVEEVDQLLKTKSNLEVLYHAALATGSYESTERLLQRILDLVFCWISAHRSCILIREDQHESLFAKSIDPQEPDKYVTKPFDIEYAVIKYVFRKKEGVIVNDILNDERFPYVIEGASLKDRQIICAPIKSRYGIRGVIYADKSKLPMVEGDSIGPPFDDQQLKLLIAIGLHAAVAIENADHYAMMLQSEKVTAVGNAMSSLSHHIKNILQSINGGNHLIEDGIANKQFDLIQGGWNIVQKNQQNLSNLVMDMLSFSRTSSPRLETANLITLIEHALEGVKALNVEIEFEHSDDVIDVTVEPELVRRAVSNILEFCINSCRENSGGVVHVNAQKSDDGVEIQFKDDGLSLSAHEISGIFDPLAISERSSRIGLGMAVAKKLIHEMAGRIEVESTEDSPGSRFLVSFPLLGEGAVVPDVNESAKI